MRIIFRQNIFLLLILTMFIDFSFAQTDTTSLIEKNKTHRPHNLALKLGYIFQKNQYLEFGFQPLYIVSQKHESWINPFIAADYNFDKKIFGPKIGGEFIIYGLIGTKLTLTNYTDFKNNEFYFSPQIGLCSCFFSILYGYNFKFKKTDTFDNSKQKISISINIPDTWLCAIFCKK